LTVTDTAQVTSLRVNHVIAGSRTVSIATRWSMLRTVAAWRRRCLIVISESREDFDQTIGLTEHSTRGVSLLLTYLHTTIEGTRAWHQVIGWANPIQVLSIRV